MDLFSFMTAGELCHELRPVLRIAGYVVLGIQIAAPIVLIYMGLTGFLKATAEKDDQKIKAAQETLVKRAVAAVAVFLVVPIVNVLMNVIVKNNEYKACTECLLSPNRCATTVEE